MISDARNALPTFDQCFQNWMDSQTDGELREACQVGSDLLEGRCSQELGERAGRTFTN